MKIFLLVFFTFSFYGLGKAQRTDNHKDPHKFDVEYEYDDTTHNFHDETSAVIDSDQNNGNIFEKREHRKCFPPVSTGTQNNNPDATYKVIIQHNSGPVNPPGGLMKCYPERKNDRESPDLPDYEIPQIHSEGRDSCGKVKKCYPKGKKEATIPEKPDFENSERNIGDSGSCGKIKKCYPKGKKVATIPEKPHFENSERSIGDSGSCACGLESKGDIETLINGTIVKPPNKYPWMVSIETTLNHGHTKCGGTLINEQYIVTAAHCLGKDPIAIKVAFVTNTSDVSPGPPIATIFPYSEYDDNTNLHDIALLKLRRRIQCNSFTRPICLPKPGLSDNIGKEFVTIGWGIEGDAKGGTKDLMEAKIKRVPFRQCPSRHQKFKEHFYCVTGVQGVPCVGDSGGPMFVKHRQRHYLFGITSMGQTDNGKCATDEPFLYTKVPKYMTWINTMIKQASRLSLVLPKRSRQKLDEAGSQRKS